MGHLTRWSHFRSAVLPSERQITIYTPPGYHTSPNRYPVLYLHDGQNLFEPERAYTAGQIWHVAATANHLIEQNLIEPLIIVGIDHAGVHRIDELTPTRDLKAKRGGQAKAYGRMLTDEIKPKIDQEFRTRPGPAHTGLGGSSLGGLATLYLGFRLPLVFGKLAILSPSLWWDNGLMLDRIRMNRHAPRARIWLDIGTREGRAHVQQVRNTRRLRDILTTRGWREGADLHYFEDPGATHSEHAWAHRLPSVLRFLYPPRPTDEFPEGDDGIW